MVGMTEFRSASNEGLNIFGRKSTPYMNHKIDNNFVMCNRKKKRVFRFKIHWVPRFIAGNSPIYINIYIYITSQSVFFQNFRRIGSVKFQKYKIPEKGEIAVANCAKCLRKTADEGNRKLDNGSATWYDTKRKNYTDCMHNNIVMDDFKCKLGHSNCFIWITVSPINFHGIVEKIKILKRVLYIF